MKLSSARLGQSKLIFGLGTLLIVGGFLCFYPVRRETLQPIVVLPFPYSIPPQKGPLPDRWIPRSWGWLWRTKEIILGRPRIVTLQPSVFEFIHPADSLLVDHVLGTPGFQNTNGLKIWLAPQPLIRELRQSLEQTNISRLVVTAQITTGDKGQASMSCSETVPINGTNQEFGLKADFLPLIHPESVDLMSILTVSELHTNRVGPVEQAQSVGLSVRTNLGVAARLQIPRGSGVFILQSSTAFAEGKVIGLILTSDLPKRK